MKTKLLFLIGLFCVGLSFATRAADVIYVTNDGTGDGSSWENAASFTNAAEAARVQDDKPDIWVKEGVYIFTESINFDDLFIYGGFNGNETALEQRNWAAHQTIFDGDNTCSPLRNTTGGARPGGNDNEIPCLLDGIIVQNGLNPNDANGGGMIINFGAVIRNCIFRNNETQNGKNGGAIHCNTNDCTIENSLFINNTSSGNGGAIQIGGGTSVIARSCTFTNNKATGNNGLGGAFGTGNNGSNLTLINSIAYNNQDKDGNFQSYGQNADINAGGAIMSIHSAVESSSSKFGDENDDNHIALSQENSPGFKAPASIIGKGTAEEVDDINNASYELTEGSVCIDAGDNDAVGDLDFDLAHQVRIFNDVVDMGVYEYNPSSSIFQLNQSSNSVSLTVKDNLLIVTGVTQGEVVQLFNVNGQVIKSKITGSNNIVEFNLINNGIYLVRAGNITAKVTY